MNLLRNFALGSIALAASLAANAAGFQNGGFENGAPQPPLGSDVTLGPGDTSMTGWTSYGLEWSGAGNGRSGDVAWLKCPGGCWTDLTPSQGQNFVDLTGYAIHDYGAIYQTFDTVAGTTYNVSFDLGRSDTWTGAGNAAQLFAVAHAGASIIDDSDPSWLSFTNTNQGWASRGFSFVATSATTSLFFAGGYNSNDYIGLDNVTVTAAPVPEPETYAMMLAGLGALGFIARRRKAQ